MLTQSKALNLVAHIIDLGGLGQCTQAPDRRPFEPSERLDSRRNVIQDVHLHEPDTKRLVT